MKKINEGSYILILPDIRSAENVGAMFRTADAFGISKIYLTGITPCPKDQFGRPNAKIAKAALGAESWIAYEYKKTLAPLLARLSKEGYTLVAIEQNKNSIDYRKVPKVDKMVFVMGPEVEGLDPKIISLCHVTAEIPMYGKKESLNVSVACGIALSRIIG